MRSINSKIMIAFIIINITVTSFFSYFLYTTTSSIIVKNYIGLTDTTTLDAIKRIDMFLDKIDKYSMYLIINKEIVNILTKEHGENVNYPRLFAEQVRNLTITEGDITAIQYISSEGDAYNYPITSDINNIEDLKQQKLITDAQLNENKIHWTDIYTQEYYQSDRKQKVKVFSGIRSFKTSFQAGIKGLLSLDINEETLYEFVKNINLGDNGNIYIVGSSGKIITSSDRSAPSQNIDEGIFRTISGKPGGYSYLTLGDKKSLVVFNTSANTGWKIVATIPLQDVLNQTRYFKLTAGIVAVVVILLSSLVSFYISSKITRPVRDMTKLVKLVAQGNLDVKYEVKTRDELKDLGDGFNYMTSSLKELINKVYIEELQLKQAQLENMKSKINPHFLYNTLDTIYWMLVIEKQTNTAKLVVALSNMLRYSISNERDQVTIEEELNQIDNYLYIQKTRFKDRLMVEYELEEDITEYYIMKLIVQPLVENAIKHGLECQSKVGKITIKGFEKDGDVVIQIIDDGKGMTDEEIENALSPKKEAHTLNKPGIGVNNVDQRIKMYYGAEYGLSIESRPGEGTCVSIRIPKVIMPGGDADAKDPID